MASFKCFSNTFSGFSRFAIVAVVGGACSVQLSADFSGRGFGDGGAGGEFELSGTTTAVGSGGGVIIPDGAVPTEASTSFAEMCGGGCMSGDKSITCSFPMNPDNPPSTSCQIVPTTTGPVAECLAPGSSQVGDPCLRASDCAASLGCVRLGSDVAVCRPYCCGDLEACAAGTYCALGNMAEDVLNDKPLQIPVCVQAIPCTLLDDTTCTDGRTCTLVRADGTTSCVTPGPGKLGDPCPCSPDHVCSIAPNTCLKLCHVGEDDCPDKMICQGGSEGFPDGIGVCVK